MGMRVSFALLFVAAGALAGCFEESPLQRAQAVCGAYCECFGTNGTVDTCVDECVVEIPPVSDECLDCVVANSQMCTDLATACNDVCDDDAQP